MVQMVQPNLLTQLYRHMAYMVIPIVCDYCGCHHDDVAHGPQISQVVVYRLPVTLKGCHSNRTLGV